MDRFGLETDIQLDSRKEMKRRIAELEEENAALKAGGAEPGQRAADAAEEIRTREGRSEATTSIPGTPEPVHEADESLLVDMPSLPGLDSSPPVPRRSTTARTFSYGPGGKPAKPSKSKTKSKYFSTPPPRGVLVAASSPSPLKPAHTVLPLSPEPLRERSRTNPFKKPQAREVRGAKRPSPSPERDIITIDDDTPPRPPMKPAPQPGIIDLFADRNGRPKKGLAVGPRSRRRA